MIIKSLTSKVGRFGQLLSYLTLDQSKTVNERGETFVLKKFLKGNTIEEMTREFLMNEQKRLHRRSNNSRLIHEVLSFSDLDRSKITIEHLKTLTEAYLEKRSPLMQSFAIAHFDQDHYHCHIVSSPVDITGRNLRMSKETFSTIKRELQAFQLERFPELSHSVVNHGQKEQDRQKGKSIDHRGEKEKTMAIRNSTRISDKAKAREAIESCMIMAESKEHYFELLSQSGFQPYQRGQDYKGLSDGSRNYRFNTLINNYAERFESLDQKQERIEDLREAREDANEREVDHEMERQSYDLEDEQEDDNNSDED